MGDFQAQRGVKKLDKILGIQENPGSRPFSCVAGSDLAGDVIGKSFKSSDEGFVDMVNPIPTVYREKRP